MILLEKLTNELSGEEATLAIQEFNNKNEKYKRLKNQGKKKKRRNRKQRIGQARSQ